MFERIKFQNKLWQVLSKVPGEKVDNHTKLKSMYKCDLVLKNSQNQFFILNEIIDVEFEDI
tara:strand:- start:717 stop:899 length:183 start_codon:yes stop_codon:yes gene_type:complete